jgi:CubicO group peptidase (beta-lactamase class C family)
MNMRNNNFKIYLLIVLLLAFCNRSNGQQSTISENQINSNIHSEIDSLLNKGLQDKMFPGVGIALFKNDSTQFFNYGLAKIESKIAVSKQTKFQLGSIGKLITAIAVLQMVDQGKLEMKTDITEYIKDLGLDLRTKDNPVTLHCLLTHSCGFNDTNIGYMAKDEGSVLPLMEYVRKTNPGLFQAPGTDINYSNYSYALAGFIVQKVTNTEFATYVDSNIFNPLEMANSTFNFPYGYETKADYANAYTKTDEGYNEVQIYPRHAIPAGSLVSTQEDMGLFVKALFNKDSNILSANSWKLFYTQQFNNHLLLNGYGYGLEHQNINGYNSWAKGGMLPGVLSHILIVPNEFAIFSVVNTSDDNFGESFYKTLFDKTFPDSTSVKELKKNVSTTKYTGIYRDKRYNRKTEENIVSLFRGQWRVYDNKTSDSLVVYHNGKWHSYIPVNEGVFQNDVLPYEYLVFKENEKGEIIALYRNLNIGGLSIPTSYEKTTWYNSPMFLNEYYGIVPLFTFTGFLFILFSLFVRLIRIWKKDFFRSKLLPVRFHILFSTIIILHILHTILVPWQLMKNIQEFLLGYPDSFKIVSLVGYLLIPLTIGLGFFIWKIWNDRLGSLFSRFYLSLVEVSLLIHLAFLFYWNFL